eukprot:Rmarinus@m.23808
MRGSALLVAFATGMVVCHCVESLWSYRTSRRKTLTPISKGFVGTVGNTPLVYIESLSELTGCQIYAKAEYLNGGCSVKDRVALQIVKDAEARGDLKEGGTIVEGTAGSTGVSLALLAACRGYKCHIFMPNDQAMEKVQLLERFGATVCRVPPVSISNQNHFVNAARHMAEETDGAFFSDQFENLSNYRAHYLTTGPEIWAQTKGEVSAFVAAAGTGGTLAGISAFLKEKNSAVKCFLIDPPGSSLYNRVVHGVLYNEVEQEGKRLGNPFDTVTEGIGINRLTANFSQASLDGAVRGSDQEAVSMSRFLLACDGLFVGSSSAMNCVGAVKVARLLGPGHVIVTVLGDGGHRHLSRFWNDSYLENLGLRTNTPKGGLDFVGGPAECGLDERKHGYGSAVPLKRTAS